MPSDYSQRQPAWCVHGEEASLKSWRMALLAQEEVARNMIPGPRRYIAAGKAFVPIAAAASTTDGWLAG